MPTSYFMPARILSGKGCVKEHASLLAGMGRHALIVTGRTSARANGALADTVAALEKENVSWSLFDRIEANPSIETIREAAALGRAQASDMVIGIGGGSPMDAAKAVAALLTNPLEGDALFAGFYPNPVPPIVCIPTTAGTGSEATPYAILTDHAMQTKRNMGGSELFPRIAFLDASYMMGLPWSTTLNTALDALSHAAEGFLAIRGTALSEPFAVTGLKQMIQVLRELAVLWKEGVPADEIPFVIRESALIGSMFGGITIAQTGTTLLHAMGYCLTYCRNIDHGLANALLMPAYFEFLEKKMPDRMKLLFGHLGFSSAEAFTSFLKTLFVMMEALPESDIDAYAAIAAKAKNMSNTPVPVSLTELSGMFAACRLPSG